ncbi:MAG: ABC transporter, partial [Gammaproteobacteria bacterium]|nr:ABC transporter [Gammaproteobacteria bacterium]
MSDDKPMTQKTTGALKLLTLAAGFIFLILLSNTFLKGVRLDLTENGLYSVSAGTMEILSKIDQPLTLRF